MGSALGHGDVFFDVIRKGLECKEAAVCFAEVLLKGKMALDLEMKQDAIVWGSSALAPLVEIANRLEAVGRFFSHIFCVDVADGMKETSDADVQVIVQYAGRHLLEKGLQRIINDPESWWKKEIDDMVKTGAGSVLAAMKIGQLQEWIREEGTWSWQTLASATNAFSEVRVSCRSQKLGQLQDDFIVTWAWAWLTCRV